jgi:colanic acid/amylovoran biosynthesis protein
MIYVAGTVEIDGPNAENKGDALMIHAVATALGLPEPSTPLRGLSQIALVRRVLNAIEHRVLKRLPAGVAWRLRAFLIGGLGDYLRRRLNLLRYRDIGLLLDCSGFQYTDQRSFLVRHQRRLAVHYESAKRAGAAVVFLPQAFGSFDIPNVRRTAKRLLASADRIFTRDHTSMKHVDDLGISCARTRIVPDITIGLRGNEPEDRRTWKQTICIVPNVLMTQMVDQRTASMYAPLLRFAISRILESGYRPILVVHSKGDGAYCRELARQFRPNIGVYDLPALETKGVIAHSRAVIGSRFHALVSALSSSVIALGTGWTHKYRELFTEFGCETCLLTDIADEEFWEAWVDQALDDRKRELIQVPLKKRLPAMKARVDEMWQEIRTLRRNVHQSAQVSRTSVQRMG